MTATQDHVDSPETLVIPQESEDAIPEYYKVYTTMTIILLIFDSIGIAGVRILCTMVELERHEQSKIPPAMLIEYRVPRLDWYCYCY